MKNNMRKYFLISGYWLDDGSEFYDYLVTNFDDEEEDGRFSEEEVQDIVQEVDYEFNHPLVAETKIQEILTD